MKRLTFLVVVTLTLASMTTPAGATYTVTYNFGAGLYAEAVHPGSLPPGASDWTCRSVHDPVILVHGTFADMTDSFQALSPLLRNHGFCPYAFNYGGSAGNPIQGYGDIRTSAAQLASFVDVVLSRTGATKVDIVGHSQGGMMPRYYIKYLGGAAKVHTLIGLSPSNHGTTLLGLATLSWVFPGAASFFGLCPACGQQIAGSSFLSALNSGGDVVPGVHYFVIQTQYDEIVTPYQSAFLAGAINIKLQSYCWLDFGDHVSMIYDPVALGWVLNMLDPAHMPQPGCTLVFPWIG